jgi:hypothetical protein
VQLVKDKFVYGIDGLGVFAKAKAFFFHMGKSLFGQFPYVHGDDAAEVLQGFRPAGAFAPPFSFGFVPFGF